MRHAKSSWRDAQLDDHERPLSGRGRRAAQHQAKVALNEGIVPELILCSTAVRAVETANLFIESSGFDGSLELTRRLYLAEPPAYLDVLSEVPEGTQTVLVVGHNPGISELVCQMTNEEVDMPTASLARIALNEKQLCQIGPTSRGQLVEFYRAPKEEKKRQKPA